MSIPKSVIKMKKNNLTYTSNVDRVNYTMNELTRAALRDVGKFVCKKFKIAFYKNFKKHSRKVAKYTQYWVRKRDKDLQVGIKPNAFYGGFQEFGTFKTERLGLLEKTVKENIPEIIEIESKYLNALEDEAKALKLIKENEYQGGGDN